MEGPEIQDEVGESSVPDTVLVGTEDAAQALGIASRTVRKRINTGELTATKLNGAWFVELPRDQVKSAGIPIPDPGKEISEHDQLPIVGASRAARAASGTVAIPDLEPMAELIADLTRKSIESASAAAMWQERAQQLADQKASATLALEAGELDHNRKIEELESAIEQARQDAAAEARKQAGDEWRNKSWWKRLRGE